MRDLFFASVVSAAVLMVSVYAHHTEPQQARPANQSSAPSADPYANNAKIGRAHV